MTTARKPEGSLRALAGIRAGGGVLIPELKAAALRTAGPDPGRASHLIHASEMAKADWCPRATYYRITGQPEPRGEFSFTLESIFDEGNAIHAKWQERMRQTGKLWGSWRCIICGEWEHQRHEPARAACLFARVPHIWRYMEVPLESPDHRITGHEDGAMIEPGGGNPYLVEIKSVGIGTLRVENNDLLSRYYHAGAGIYDLDRLWRELSRPLPGHVRQGNVYLWLAAQMGLPFPAVRFLYEAKWNQQVKEFSITMSEDIIGPLLGTVQCINSAVADGMPPECPAGGCKYCNAFEEASDGGQENPGEGGAAAGPVPPGGIRRRRQPARGTGDQPRRLGTQARQRAAAPAAPRRDRPARPAADGPVRRRRPVAAVPEPPAGRRRGR